MGQPTNCTLFSYEIDWRGNQVGYTTTVTYIVHKYCKEHLSSRDVLHHSALVLQSSKLSLSYFLYDFSACKEACSWDFHIYHYLNNILLVFNCFYWTHSGVRTRFDCINSTQMHNCCASPQHCVSVWRYGNMLYSVVVGRWCWLSSVTTKHGFWNSEHNNLIITVYVVFMRFICLSQIKFKNKMFGNASFTSMHEKNFLLPHWL